MTGMIKPLRAAEMRFFRIMGEAGRREKFISEESGGGFMEKQEM